MFDCLEEVSKANRPGAFRWDLMPPSLVTATSKNKNPFPQRIDEDVSMTNILRSHVSKRREDLEAVTPKKNRKNSNIFEEQVSLSEGLRRRRRRRQDSTSTDESKEKSTKRRRTVIETYRPPRTRQQERTGKRECHTMRNSSMWDMTLKVKYHVQRMKLLEDKEVQRLCIKIICWQR